MSSLHIEDSNQITIPNTFMVPNEEGISSYSARVYKRRTNGYRSYATVTEALNKAYRNYKAGGGSSCGSCSSCGTVCKSHGGTGSTGCSGGGCTCHCSGGNCQQACRSKGYTYVSTNGNNCTCDRGTSVKCNLTGAICKANNPRATSCAVRTYTNGSCVCDCKTGTGQNLTPPAAPGTVKSVSKPVTSTNIKPGVVPKSVPPNTKFGSMDVATLQKSPPATHSALVAQQAALRDLNGLQAAQTYAASELAMSLAAVDAAEKGSRDELVAARKRLTDARWKWNQAFYATAYAKNPKGFLAMVKGNPIQEPEVKGVVIETVKVGGTEVVKQGLSKALSNTQVGGIPSPALVGPATGTVSKLVTGVSTNHWPSLQDITNDWVSSSKDIANALSPGKVQGAAVGVVPGLWQLVVQAGDEMANRLSPAQEY